MRTDTGYAQVTLQEKELKRPGFAGEEKIGKKTFLGLASPQVNYMLSEDDRVGKGGKWGVTVLHIGLCTDL